MGRLEYYRKKIDFIDKNIVKLLLERFNLAGQIADYKKKNKIKILDRKREAQVINNIKKYSKSHEKFMAGNFKDIMKYSKKLQK